MSWRKVLSGSEDSLMTALDTGKGTAEPVPSTRPGSFAVVCCLDDCQLKAVQRGSLPWTKGVFWKTWQRRRRFCRGGLVIREGDLPSSFLDSVGASFLWRIPGADGNVAAV